VRIYCLTLPEQEERRHRAEAHFAEVGLENVEFFEGIHGEVSGLRTVHTYDLDNPGYIMGPKPIGIWLSHFMLWSHIAAGFDPVRDDHHAMILEIDAKFPADWKEKFPGVGVPPYADFFFLGHCCLSGTHVEQVTGNIYKTDKPQCTHCYIVRVGALKEALRLLRRVWAPFDIQVMLEILPKFKTYAVIPRLVDQFDTELPP
jgi:GR25 family glycosyltransferase involved in LPS biosynthesis